MLPIFQTCVPRDELFSGELREEIFAARLRDVIEGRAEPVYQNPVVFFDNTYPTAGLRLLLNEALGRLTGKQASNNAIIRLETAFGGGKTHNLIALYHASSGMISDAFVASELIPEPDTVLTVGIVGSDLDPSSGVDHGSIRTYTLWGEIVYQIGNSVGRGTDFYSAVAESEQTKTAPGTSMLDSMMDTIGDRPVLIMLDEIARHLRSAKTIPTATGKSDLGEQTVAFLMSLFEFAASRPHVVIVFTLADNADAFGTETEELRQEIARALSEAGRIAARQERVITPTAENEIAAIVTHRLFASIDPEAANLTAQTYGDYYQTFANGNADIPSRSLRADYTSELAAYYPFHPELLNTLNRKTSTIPNFQKTRGALRLLALVVRDLWTQRPADCYMIHLHHINLANEGIANDLTSRLERPRFQQVIEADIVSPLRGSQSHAQTLDQATGGVSYAQHTGTAVLLHSLTQGGTSGVDPADLTLSVMQPDDDPALILRAVNRLVETGWFIEYDGHRYRFKTEPSLNKIVADEMSMVGLSRAKAEIDGRIPQIWKPGFFRPSPTTRNLAFPSEPGDVDDDAAQPPQLVITHYDAAQVAVDDDQPPELVLRIFEYTGAQQSYRIYKNNLVFLVADRQQVPNMVRVTQRYLAIQRITGDTERMREFFPEQRQKLENMRQSAELDVRIAITKAYRWLFYPSNESPRENRNLAREQLPPQEQGDTARDQSDTLLRFLKQIEKVITAETPMLSGRYVRARAWDVGMVKISTQGLLDMFARKTSLRMMLDVNQIKKTITNGIEQGDWVYYDGDKEQAHNATNPPPIVKIGENYLLYDSAEATRLNLLHVEVVPEPLIVKPVGGTTRPSPRITPMPPAALPLRGEGAPGQAFQQLADACKDSKVSHLGQLTILVEGEGATGGKEIKSFGLVIPQLGRGSFIIEQRLSAEYDNREGLTLDVTFGWDRYRRAKSMIESMASDAKQLTAQTTLTIVVPGGLEVEGGQFSAMKAAFTKLEFGYMVVRGERGE